MTLLTVSAVWLAKHSPIFVVKREMLRKCQHKLNKA